MNDGNVCILVVDDELPVLEMLKLLLERMGYIVDTASSGKKAISMITQNDYDVVITDIKMPEITGNQILQHVKLKNGNAFPVIGISGTPWLLEQSNFDAVLSKPCTIKELKKAMDQVLN